MSITPQTHSFNLKQQFALNNLPLHKSHSINKFAAKALKKSDNKEREQSIQLDPIKPIFDTNSNNHHKFFKLGAKVPNSKYKYNPLQNNSLIVQDKLSFQVSKIKAINAISKMPRS